MALKIPSFLVDHFSAEAFKNSGDDSHVETVAIAVGRKVDANLIVTELIYPPQNETFLDKFNARGKLFLAVHYFSFVQICRY